MSYLVKGAFIEYGTDFLGPVPNVVIFQFNPESLSRNIQIPQRPTGSKGRETSQAGELPVEKITLKAYFSAADELGSRNRLARTFGIGPRLAALEKMSRPENPDSPFSKAIDEIGDTIFSGSNKNLDQLVTQPIPREKYPRILFIWGLTRVLPVIIDSLSINEQEYDNRLNPVRAEVSLGLSVITIDKCSDDKVARGAVTYSTLAKDSQATANLANQVSQVIDLIPF